MLALKISDIKDFTNKLFIGEVFDHFQMTEASITTFNTFFIDGRLLCSFFDTDQQKSLAEHGRSFSLWKEVKPYCHSIIRGRRTPLQFKIILLASGCSDHVDTLPENTNGRYLNIQYKNNSILCTTGVSQYTFTPDKTLEQNWDYTVLDFFQKKEIIYENI